MSEIGEALMDIGKLPDPEFVEMVRAIEAIKPDWRDLVRWRDGVRMEIDMRLLLAYAAHAPVQVSGSDHRPLTSDLLRKGGR